MKNSRSTLGIILGILFLSFSNGKSPPLSSDHPIVVPNFHQSISSQSFLLNDLRPISDSENKTESNGVSLNLHAGFRIREADVEKIASEFGGAMKDLTTKLNQTYYATSQNDSKTVEDFFMIPTKFLQQTFQKGELGWLNRQKTIESLWLHNEGADPKSPSGIAYSFSAPNQQSIWLSNTSILLEYASKAFLNGFNNNNSKGRSKRQSNFLSSLLSPDRNPFAKVDITPFVPAQEYIAKCGVNEEISHCDASKRYRTYSGWCNNLKNPGWGKSVLAYDRMLPPVYDDGISVPKLRAVSGKLLPSPRYASSMVHIDVSQLSQRHTLMFMQYAQFLDHDMTFTPVNKGPGNAILNCRDCDSTRTVHPECWPITIPATDSYYPAQAAAASGKEYCTPFTRSLAGQQRLGPREQINQNSAYLDSSQIYGENYCKGMSLRSGGGMLNVTFSASQGGKVLMPQVTQMKECRSPSGYCFYAGDSRASEQPALAAVHTIYLREHNRISGELHRVNPHWSEEILYQESRRVLGAINQHVAYNEFLPRLIGPILVNAYGLGLQNEGYYTGYDPNCAATVYNEFSTSAFRFGHSLIRPHLARMDNKYNGMNPHIPLRDGFFNSDMLYKSLMVDEIIRGLVAEPMEQMDPFITKEITNHLFEDKKHSFSGMDLIALNLHRGRDHGLQGYNAYRAACDLPRAATFQDLLSEIPSEVITRLQHVYEHVDDIDLFTGSIVERPVSGGIVGPTMACIIANQFKKLRKCDRFWYETNDPLLQFTPVQLAEIRKATLSKIICENFDMPSEIQKNAFDAPHNFLNPRLPCNRLPTVNMEAWQEKPSAQNSRGCKIGNKNVAVGEGGLSSPCVSCVCTSEGTKCASLRITSCARLTQEASREDIMKDTVCTSQCGLWLGIPGSSNSNYSPISSREQAPIQQHNDINLQMLHPPPPTPRFTRNRFRSYRGRPNNHFRVF